MRNKKLKLALSELEKEMEVISNKEMRYLKGGYGEDTLSGVINLEPSNPSGNYSYDEYLDFYLENRWRGGFVDFIGYISEGEMALPPVSAVGIENPTGILNFYENYKHQIDGFLFSNSLKSELIGIAESMGEISSAASKYSSLFKAVGVVGGGLQATYSFDKMRNDYYNNGYVETEDMLDFSVSVVGTVATIFLSGTPVGAAIAVGTGAYFVYRFVTED